MRFLLGLLAASLVAQTISVTTPAGDESISGNYVLKSTCTSCPSLYRVQYKVGDEIVGYGYQTTGYQFTWDTLERWNGKAHIVAVALDALDATIATSATVRFDIANSYYNLNTPYNVPSGARTTSLSVTDPNTAAVIDTGSNAPSTWTGTVNIPVTVTGATAGEIAAGIQYSVNVDGKEATVNGIDPDGLTYTSATPSVPVNTAKFANGSRFVRVVARYSTGQLPNSPIYVWYGAWQGFVTFANTTSPIGLVLNVQDKIMATNDTHQITAEVLRADGSRVAASGLTYTWTQASNGVNDPNCTVNGSGLVTATGGTGRTCIIKVQDSNGFSRYLWVQVNNGTNTLNLGLDGVVRTNYTAGSSSYVSGIFQAGNQFTDPLYSGYGAEYKKAGFDYFEAGMSPSIGPNETYSNYVSNLTNNYVNPANAIATTYSLKCLLRADSLVFGGDSLWNITRAGPASWTPKHAVTATMDGWVGGCGFAVQGTDEVNANFGTCPLCPTSTTGISAGGPFTGISVKTSSTQTGTSYTFSYSNDCGRMVRFTNNGTITATVPDVATLPANCVVHARNDGSGTLNLVPAVSGQFRNKVGFDPIVITAGTHTALVSNISTLYDIATSGEIPQTNTTICTLAWTNWEYGGGTGTFILAGGTTANINSDAGETYFRGRIINSSMALTNVNRFEFACPDMTGDVEITSSTDPNLRIEIQGIWWYNSSGQSSDCVRNPGNCGSGPYTDYLRNDAFTTFMTDYNASSNPLPLTWPVHGHTPAHAQENWMADDNISDYATFYFSPTAGGAINPRRASMWQWYNGWGHFSTEKRWRPGVMRKPRAWLSLTTMTAINYGFIGRDVAISSIADDIVTFTGDHGIRSFTPGIARLAIRGSSNSAYNTEFYIFAAPTSTTLKIARARPTFEASSASGTANWEDGSTTAMGAFTSDSTAYLNSFGPEYNGGDLCGLTGLSKWGQTFTVTSGTDPDLSGKRFVFIESFNRVTRTLCNRQYWRELPSGSSTGGTANILPDNKFHANYTWNTGATQGPDPVFINPLWALALGASGQRAYTTGGNNEGYSPNDGWSAETLSNKQSFNSGTAAAVQQGGHPYWDTGADSVKMFNASGMGTRSAQRFIPFFFRPKLSPADYGEYVDCAYARINAIQCINASTNQQTITVDLTPYRVAGQACLTYTSTWQGITIGTVADGDNSESPTIPVGGTWTCICPSNYAAEYRQPTVSANLGSVGGATKVIARWGYDSYSIDEVFGQVTDCGSGSCTLPVDTKIGAVYYRLIYLNSSGKELARSGIMTIAKTAL